MILSLTSFVPSDRQDLELLLVQPYSALNFYPHHLTMSREEHSHTGTLRLAALVVLGPYGH